MKCSWLSLVISLSLLTCGARVVNARQTAAPDARADRQSEKVRRAVEKTKVGGRITVYARDGCDYRGFVESFDAAGFQIVERKTQRVVAFKYADVKKTRGGWRHPRRGSGMEAAIVGGGLILFLALVLRAGLDER